jgi:hypothetical protein
MSEKPPPDGINCRSLRRLRDRQFIPSAVEDAKPSVQVTLRLRFRLAARRPTGSLTLRPSLRLNPWIRNWRSRRSVLVHAEGWQLWRPGNFAIPMQDAIELRQILRQPCSLVFHRRDAAIKSVTAPAVKYQRHLRWTLTTSEK